MTMNVIKARERSLPSLINFQAVFVSFDQATMLIFYNLMYYYFPMEKYPCPLSLKFKSICKCYTAVLPLTFSARISVSHGWIQHPFIFNLKCTDDNGGMKEDTPEMKSNRKIKINFHMQLDTFWCTQLNGFPQLAKAALKVLLPLATNYLC